VQLNKNYFFRRQTKIKWAPIVHVPTGIAVAKLDFYMLLPPNALVTNGCICVALCPSNAQKYNAFLSVGIATSNANMDI
jgi:hypothetical protein